MTDTRSYNVTESYISQTPGFCDGEPCIAGRRIKVRHIYVWYEIMGKSADEIANHYDLSLPQVHAALAFAYENLDTIRQAINDEDLLVAKLKSKYPSKLKSLTIVL